MRFVSRRSKGSPMSALGQKRTLRLINPMSALPPKADIAEPKEHVPFVPLSELCASKKLFGGVLVQAGALLINHIAPRRRTLTPSA
jgi:hypothetical protein